MSIDSYGSAVIGWQASAISLKSLVLLKAVTVTVAPVQLPGPVMILDGGTHTLKA